MAEKTGNDSSTTEIVTKNTSSTSASSSVGTSRSVSTKTLYRLSAAALVVSGLALAIGEFLHPSPPFADSVATTQWAAAHVLWWLGGLTAAVGFAGLYLRQRDAVGWLGFVGSGFAVLGSVLIACAMFFEAFIAPTIAAQAPALFEAYPAGGGWEGFLAGVLAAGALIGVGLILFGIAMYRAGLMPRWAIVLTILGGVPFAVNFLLPHLITILAATTFGVGLAGLGRGLWQNSERPNTHTSISQ